MDAYIQRGRQCRQVTLDVTGGNNRATVQQRLASLTARPKTIRYRTADGKPARVHAWRTHRGPIVPENGRWIAFAMMDRRSGAGTSHLRAGQWPAVVLLPGRQYFQQYDFRRCRTNRLLSTRSSCRGGMTVRLHKPVDGDPATDWGAPFL
jgi:hypothetical protein